MKSKIVVKDLYVLSLPGWEPVAYHDFGLVYVLASLYLRMEGLSPERNPKEILQILQGPMRECLLFGAYHGIKSGVFIKIYRMSLVEVMEVGNEEDI